MLNSNLDPKIKEYAEKSPDELKDLLDIATYQLCQARIRGENRLHRMSSIEHNAEIRVQKWKGWLEMNERTKKFDDKIYQIATSPTPPSDAPTDLAIAVYEYCILISTRQKVEPKTYDGVVAHFKLQDREHKALLDEQKRQQEEMLKPHEEFPEITTEEGDALIIRLKKLGLEDRVQEVMKTEIPDKKDHLITTTFNKIRGEEGQDVTQKESIKSSTLRRVYK